MQRAIGTEKHKRAFLLSAGVFVLGAAGFYFLTTLMTSFATQALGVDKADMLRIMSWVGVVELIAFPLASYAATRTSERLVLVVTAAAAFVFAIPMMMLVVSGSLANIYVAILVAIVFVAAHYAVMAPALTRAFPVHLRYTGIALASSVSGIVFSSLTPILGLWLVRQYGVEWLPLALLFLLIAGISLVCSVLLPMEEG